MSCGFKRVINEMTSLAEKIRCLMITDMTFESLLCAPEEAGGPRLALTIPFEQLRKFLTSTGRKHE